MNKTKIRQEYKKLQEDYKELKNIPLKLRKFPHRAKVKIGRKYHPRFLGVYNSSKKHIEMVYDKKHWSSILILLHEVGHAIQYNGVKKKIIKTKDCGYEETDADRFMVNEFARRYAHKLWTHEVIDLLKSWMLDQVENVDGYDPKIIGREIRKFHFVMDYIIEMRNKKK